AMEIAAAAKANGAMFLGPNTLGVLSPGKGVVGMIGGRAESARQWFKPGVPKGVGVISRSGGMASSTGYYLGQAGVRISTIVHIGGDAVIGIRLSDAALMFEADPLTEAIVIFGEIGSSQEEELAQLIAAGKITKPVIAYIGGKAAREGTRFSHAGAIIEGGRGTHAGKVKALREAGGTVVDAFGELPNAVVEILGKMKGESLMNEADKKAVWNTAITRVEPNKVAVRGYDIADLMGRVSFGAAVYVVVTGELPSQAVGRWMDAILVSSSDHGATPPSALAARGVASTGATLSASVAAGIMSINRHHGGAIEDCARQLKAIADRAARESISIDEAAALTLVVMREAGERMPGFGHRLHTKDPRTVRLFELAREAGVDGVHIQAARAVEKAFAAAKKSLPINVDGAIGAILADLGMDPQAFNVTIRHSTNLHMKRTSTLQSAFFNIRVLLAAVLCSAGMFIALLGSGAFSNASAQGNAAQETKTQQFGQTTVIHAWHSDLSRPLREQPLNWPPMEVEHEANLNPKIPHQPQDGSDPVIQSSFWQRMINTPAVPGPVLTWAGIAYPGVSCNCAPPDPDGEVGKTQYVQMVNEGFQVFDKVTGTSVFGPVAIGSVWSGFGCSS